MWVHNVVLFLFTLASPRSHSGSATDGETGEKADKLTSPRNHSSRCAAYAMAGEAADESSCKAVALCADVEVAEHEGVVEADRVETGGSMPKSMQSSRLTAEAQLDLPNPTTCRGRKHALVLPISGIQGRGPQPCGCVGRIKSNVGEDASASRSLTT
jgi:hypothetical protein